VGVWVLVWMQGVWMEFWYEFEGNLAIVFEGDSHKLEVTPNLRFS
jgi:hypothetical protein